jgi:hypothetical protein
VCRSAIFGGTVTIKRDQSRRRETRRRRRAALLKNIVMGGV